MFELFVLFWDLLSGILVIENCDVELLYIVIRY